jgi:hypothetical protein
MSMKEDAATHPTLAGLGVSVSSDVIEEVAALSQAVARQGGSVPNHGRRR